MRKLARSQLNAYKVMLIRQQGGLCPMTLRPFDMRNLKDAVVDHDHITGEIRGVLSRGANGAEGKVFQAVARWGGVGQNYPACIAFLKRMIAYLEAEGTGVIYPFHKNAEERRTDRNKKAKEMRAAKAARARLAQEKQS